MQVRIELIAPADTPDPELLTDLASFESPKFFEFDWGRSIRIMGEHPNPKKLRIELRSKTADTAWDSAVLSGSLAYGTAKLIMLDVDCTFTTVEAIDLLAGEANAGKLSAEITRRAMIGEIDFQESLRERVALLRGLPISVFDKVFKQVTLQPGAPELVAAAKRNHISIGLASGGFTNIVDRLVSQYQLDYGIANTLETKNGYLTGNTIGEIIDPAGKLKHFKLFAKQQGISLDECLAVGDGANDLEMLSAANLGIAYCAKPIAAQAADARISFPRLDAISAYAGIS